MKCPNCKKNLGSAPHSYGVCVDWGFGDKVAHEVWECVCPKCKTVLIWGREYGFKKGYISERGKND